MINLSTIKNINNIEELSKHYDLIRKYAHTINPKMKEQMDDIIQESFLKLHNMFIKYPDKEIDGAYVALTLMSVYKNYLKSYQNKLDFGSTYEAYIPETIDDTDEIIEEKINEENQWLAFEDKKNELSWYDKKLLEYSFIMSLSELSRQSKISYTSLGWSLNKIKTKLKE